jgi:glycosyltransferase involved in cell wall biosynthesis
MHILIVHQAFASLDEPGGTRHYEFARYLAAQGHRVTVIASPVSYITGSRSAPPTDTGRPPHIPGVEIRRAAVYAGHHKSFIHRMLAFLSFMLSSFFIGLRLQDVDLVWGTSPPIFQGLTSWALARLKRAAFLFEVRDLWPEFAVAVGVLRSGLLIRASERLERFLYRQADCIIVNSPGFLEHVRARGARRIELIPNGADPAMFDTKADGSEFRRMLGLEGKFTVIYAGAHGMSNDLDVLLEAARLLQEPGLQIVLVGDGKEKPALVRRSQELHLLNTTFVGAVAKRQMPSVLAAADACVAILKPIEAYKTTYPNKVFDYMAAGKPVLLAIDGVIRQVVEGASCGLFVAPGDPVALADAIRYFAADRERAHRMGVNGKAYLERNFNREQIAARLLGVIESMARERR